MEEVESAHKEINPVLPYNAFNIQFIKFLPNRK